MKMNEKPNFIDPSNIPKAPKPGLEQYITKVFESNPVALSKKIELSNLLNSDPFDENVFRKLADDFNKETENVKGHEGQYTTIETFRGKHGQLKVYHYRNSDSVGFGYGFLS